MQPFNLLGSKSTLFRCATLCQDCFLLLSLFHRTFPGSPLFSSDFSNHQYISWFGFALPFSVLILKEVHASRGLSSRQTIYKKKTAPKNTELILRGSACAPLALAQRQMCLSTTDVFVLLGIIFFISIGEEKFSLHLRCIWEVSEKLN